MDSVGATSAIKNEVYRLHVEGGIHRQKGSSLLHTHHNSGGVDDAENQDTSNSKRTFAEGQVGNDCNLPGSSLDCIIEAKSKWEANLCEELVAVSMEKKVPIASRRTNVYIDDMNVTNTRFLYDSEDLLEVISCITSDNIVAEYGRRSIAATWGMIQLHLKTPTLDELRGAFPDMHPKYTQTGVDDVFGDDSKFLEERERLGNRALKSGFMPVLRAYSKRGIVHALRPKMWRAMSNLSIESSSVDEKHYEKMRKHLLEWQYVTDDLFKLDVQQTCADDNYFPFEDIIRDIVLAWSRDPWSLYHCDYKINSTFTGLDTEGNYLGAVPPCNVQPFRGLSYFVAPLSYIYPNAVDALLVFRHMFARYWCRLNVVNTDDNCLLLLCKLFEDLLQYHNPRLILHCKNLGVMPLSIAFPWIHKAFAGYFPVDQVLLLWDRIMGYDNLYLVSVLAVAVFMFRSNEIMECTDPSDVLECFQDTARLKVIPLLQHQLFLA